MKDEVLIDPVCGMRLFAEFVQKESPKLVWEGKTFCFCDLECQQRFKSNPQKFQQTPLIELRNVWKIFDLGEVKVEGLRGVNLYVWEGDFLAIIGPSGSGKSTMLHMMGLLDKPTYGQVLFRGEDVSSLSETQKAELRSKTFGFVFQQYHLIPWLTAYENVTLPLIFSGVVPSKKELENRFYQMGLGERMHHRPFELSGGEQQRVAILRALANNPQVIFGDEPTGNLDSTTGQKILDILINLHQKEKKTLVIVTHDANIAQMADQIVAVQDGRTIKDHKVHKRSYTS